MVGSLAPDQINCVSAWKSRPGALVQMAVGHHI
jgi:hypothetical protein